MVEVALEPTDVLLVVDRDVFDRFGSIIRNLCVGLMDEPVRVTVLSHSPSDSAEEAVSPWRVVRLPKQTWPWRLSAGDLLEKLELEKPQIVHCFSSALANWSRELCALWGSHQIIHVTDSFDLRELNVGELDPATTVIVHGTSLENLLLQRWPEGRNSIRVIPFGIPSEAEPCCLAQPERIPTAIVTMPLTRDCGLDRILRSLQAIIRSGQELQLFVLSTGPAERLFRHHVQQLGLISSVTFAGKMRGWSAMGDVMHGADFYIMPGVSDRFTANRLTAMAAGLAVIAPSGTTEDYLIDGTTARLFDPNRPHELAERWLALLQDRSAARDLAHAALDYVRAHYQASVMVAGTASLYQQMCGSGTHLV